jgi:hypothetical protein
MIILLYNLIFFKEFDNLNLQQNIVHILFQYYNSHLKSTMYLDFYNSFKKEFFK